MTTVVTREPMFVPAIKRSINRYCRNGHDLATEGAIRCYAYGGKTYWQCKECSRLRTKNFRRKMVPKAAIACEECKTVFRPMTCTIYCSPSCRGKASAREALALGRRYEGQPTAGEFLALVEQRDRETRAWIRAELAAKVEEMRKRL